MALSHRLILGDASANIREAAGCALVVADPPYHRITKEPWDNCFKSVDDYLAWAFAFFFQLRQVMAEDGSLLLWGGNGKHGNHAFWRLIMGLEQWFQFQDVVTVRKRRGYGSQRRWMYVREECAWFTVSKTNWTFNVQHTTEKRGYAGFNAKYPALSEFKRPGNVWTDLPELFKPARTAEKPVPWFARLIAAHSNEGDLVFDPFCGTGNSLVAARELGRSWVGCETDVEAHAIALAKL